MVGCVRRAYTHCASTNRTSGNKSRAKSGEKSREKIKKTETKCCEKFENKCRGTSRTRGCENPGNKSRDKSESKCWAKSGSKCCEKSKTRCWDISESKCWDKSETTHQEKSRTKIGPKFWRKARFLLVFLLSLMSVRSSCGGVSLGAQLVCAKTPGLTDKQRAMCRAAPAAMAAISDGLRMAYAECVSQMRGRRWNCSGVGDGKNFGHVISMATKEAAYTYAITSAGVTHALSAACVRGDLPACGCNNRRRGVEGASWQWAGARCGEGARGARLARRFLDARELEHDARALMNLHNNRLGRKMVKDQVVKECKCHGVSGSCSVRTCWRALPPFSSVAGALTQKFLRARKVAALERGTMLDGRVNLQLVVKKSQKSITASRPPRKSDLVYLTNSPSYCEPTPAAAALGTHQRRCNQTSRGEDSCSNLCCGRGHSTLHVTSRVQCRCSFHWCCKVQCDTCLVNTEHHICN